MAVVFEEVKEGGGEVWSLLRPLPLFELVREGEGGEDGGREGWRDRGMERKREKGEGGRREGEGAMEEGVKKGGGRERRMKG